MDKTSNNTPEQQINQNNLRYHVGTPRYKRDVQADLGRSSIDNQGNQDSSNTFKQPKPRSN